MSSRTQTKSELNTSPRYQILRKIPSPKTPYNTNCLTVGNDKVPKWNLSTTKKSTSPKSHPKYSNTRVVSNPTQPNSEKYKSQNKSKTQPILGCNEKN